MFGMDLSNLFNLSCVALINGIATFIFLDVKYD